MSITVSNSRIPTKTEVIALYKSVGWSAADKPDVLYNALQGSDSLVTAWAKNEDDLESLVGVGNAISDGHLVVYYPHLLIHPNFQKQGVGKMIMDKMQEKYSSFHMQMLTADKQASHFYEKLGFSQAGQTIPMWIYSGSEH